MSRSSAPSGRAIDSNSKGSGDGKKSSREKFARQLIFWEDVEDIAMTQIDALLILLIVAAILSPIMWLVMGDIGLLAVYVALLTLLCIIVIYLILTMADRRLDQLNGAATTTDHKGNEAKARKK
jgi:Ca2+/Na+ antiporter